MDGVGKGIRSREMSSCSCLNKVGVRVGEAIAEQTDFGLLPRDPWISAES